jgi:putative peptide zinc metalloprotease protein
MDIWASIDAGLNEPAETPSIHDILSDTYDLSRYYPRRIGAVSVAHFTRSGGQDYHVLKNTAQRGYVRLDESGYFLWQLMDGTRSVKDLMVAYFEAFKRLDRDGVIGLIRRLQREGMLVGNQHDAYKLIGSQLRTDDLLSRLQQFRAILFRKSVTVSGLDRPVTESYRHVVRYLFSMPFLVVYPLILLVGLYCFGALLQSGQYSLYNVANSAGLGLVVLLVVNATMVTIHEAGHAYALKHYGLDVPAGGLVFYLGLPCFFVDATDAWMAPRRQRIMVALAGPYSTALISSLLALMLILVPDLPASGIMFKLALWGYISACINLYPLLEFDGYYVLVDLLDVPMLRRKSFQFLRHRLPDLATGKSIASAREWLLGGYGLLAFLSTGALLVLSLFVVKWRIDRIFGAFDGSGSLLSGSLTVAIAVFLAVPVVLAVLGLLVWSGARILRLIKSSGITTNVFLVTVIGISGVIFFSLAVGLLIPDDAQFTAWETGRLGGGLLTAIFAFWARRLCVGSRKATLMFVLILAGIATTLVSGVHLINDGESDSAIDTAAGTMGLVGLVVYLRLRYFNGLPNGASSVSWLTIGFGLLAATVSGLIQTEDSTALLLLSRTAWLICALGLGGLILSHKTVEFRRPVTDMSLEMRDQEYLWRVLTYYVSGLDINLGLLEGDKCRGRVARALAQASETADLHFVFLAGSLVEDQPPDGIHDAAGRYRTALGVAMDLYQREFGHSHWRRLSVFLYDRLSWQQRELLDEHLLYGSRLDPDPDPELRGQVLDLVRSTSLFGDLPEQAIRQLSKAFKTVYMAAGDTIVSEGESGDRFFLIQAGIALVTKRAAYEDAVVGHLFPGDYFGELALLYDAPRNATIRCTTDMTVLELPQAAFDHLLRHSLTAVAGIEIGIEMIQFLRPIPLFSSFGPQKLSELFRLLHSMIYEEGSIIVTKGETGDRFYLVKSGEVAVLSEADEEAEHMAILGPGEYFGEIGLLRDMPRTATIRAASNVELMVLERRDFEKLVSTHEAATKYLNVVAGRRLHRLQSSN